MIKCRLPITLLYRRREKFKRAEHGRRYAMFLDKSAYQTRLHYLFNSQEIQMYRLIVYHLQTILK